MRLSTYLRLFCCGALLLLGLACRDGARTTDDGRRTTAGPRRPAERERWGNNGAAHRLPQSGSRDDGRRNTDDGTRKTEDGRRKTDDGTRKTDDGARSRHERFAFYIAGTRVGRFVAIDRVDAEGRHELVRQSDLALKRGDEEIRLSMRTVTLLDRELRPLRYSFLREEGSAGALRAEGEVRDGKVKVHTTAGGATTTREIELPPGVSFAAALELRSRHGLKDGDRFQGKVLLEEVGGLVDASYATRATADGYVIEGAIAGIKQIETLDKAGKTLRIEVPAMGGYAVPEGATPPPLTTSLDVLARTVWPAPPDMPAPRSLAATTFRIEGALATPVPEDRHQRLIERREGDPLVQLVRVERTTRGAPETLSAAARRAALAETPYEPIHDPRIQAAAGKATLGLSRPVDKVEALVRFVYQTVEQKDLTRAYAPAPETLETRVGDCTEHSVLFSALAKASGLPTRLVDGVIVADGQIGYHEWVEVYLDGEGWRPVDPTFGEALAGPNRLKLATGSSQPEELLRMGLSSASALTGLKVSVIAHERL